MISLSLSTCSLNDKHIFIMTINYNNILYSKSDRVNCVVAKVLLRCCKLVLDRYYGSEWTFHLPLELISDRLAVCVSVRACACVCVSHTETHKDTRR